MSIQISMTMKTKNNSQMEIRTRYGLFRLLVILSFVIFVSMIDSACGANENILRSGKETPAQSRSDDDKPTVERELEAMKTARFAFVYVLRRKDGAQLDAEDRSLIKLNTVDANRRVAADDDRAVIIGSNFQLAQDKLTALYKRFAVENYIDEQIANSNNTVNSNN